MTEKEIKQIILFTKAAYGFVDFDEVLPELENQFSDEELSDIERLWDTVSQ